MVCLFIYPPPKQHRAHSERCTEEGGGGSAPTALAGEGRSADRQLWHAAFQTGIRSYYRRRNLGAIQLATGWTQSNSADTDHCFAVSNSNVRSRAQLSALRGFLLCPSSNSLLPIFLLHISYRNSSASSRRELWFVVGKNKQLPTDSVHTVLACPPAGKKSSFLTFLCHSQLERSFP